MNKIYQTKPIFKKLKINITHYARKDYERKLPSSTTQKQSQNKPNQSQFFSCRKGSKAKTNPIYGEPVEPSKPIFYCAKSNWLKTEQPL
jgi:ubiquitin